MGYVSSTQLAMSMLGETAAVPYAKAAQFKACQPLTLRRSSGMYNSVMEVLGE